MQEIQKQFARHRVIPVISIEDANDADPLADALCEGGLPLVEITLRTKGALDAIYRMVRRGNLLVGAGTVISIDQVKQVIDTGAGFVVSPGFNPNVARYCLDNEIAYLPGVATPTEIQAAMEMGYHLLKFFPAEALGGIDTLKAVCAPFQTLKFIPTGGIHTGNIANYLRFSGVLACGGTWIAKTKVIADGRFDQIVENAKQACELVSLLASGS